MNILYGVVGEGMGHATRSRVVLGHLLGKGHTIRVVVSGRAHAFLKDRFAGTPGLHVEEISGLHLVYEENAVDKSASLWSNLGDAPAGVKRNVETYARVVGDFRADVVISDFESWAWLYGRAHGIPVVSIDNMQVINRCVHPEHITSDVHFQIARMAVKVKVPGAWHYIVSSFFFPPLRKDRTTLVPPILRPEILSARAEPGEHVLVYQTAASNSELLPTLRRLPYRFLVYGLGREGEEGNVTLRAFSERGFIEDLRTARAVVAGGGYSLMGECVHLHVPLLSVPLRKQYEQILNAVYLQELGYGEHAEHFDAEGIAGFLGRVEEHRQALQSYQPVGNERLFGAVDNVLAAVAGR